MRFLINMFIGICSILMALIIPFSIDIAWNLIKKAGGKGWKVFVPFYSVYEQYRLYYKPALFPLWLILFAADVACFLMPPSILLARIVLISSTGIFVLNLLWSISCAKKFSKKWWFGVGLCLLYPVFGAILTWSDKNRYDPEMFLKDCFFPGI